MKYCVLLFLMPFLCRAQVANNSIQQRMTLQPGQAVVSTTAGSTVEWTCVNKALTNKCLVYHNDQWFSFSPPTAGTWYLNIAAQQCRDNKGVQLTVIEGNPCEVKTYKLLHCLSQVRREDVYVKLDSLKKGVTYLVNVDGFLGDHCGFNLTLSENASGLPQQPEMMEGAGIDVTRDRNVVDIRWQVPPSRLRDLNAFTIFRSEGNEHAEKRIVMDAILNTLGTGNTGYRVSDTLETYGTFRYEIYGVDHRGEALLVGRNTVEYAEPHQPQPAMPMSYTSHLNLRMPEGTPFRLVVYNRGTSEKLTTISGRFKKDQHARMDIDFKEWIDQGVREFQLLIVQDQSPEPEEIYFRWDDRRGVVREY